MPSGLSRFLINFITGSVELRDNDQPDLVNLAELAIRHGLSPLLYLALKGQKQADKLPGELLNILRSNYLATTTRTSMLLHDLEKIAQKAEINKLDFLMLKGMALLAMIYEDAGSRPMDDMDILIRETDCDQWIVLLQESGFRDIKVFESQTSELLEKESGPGWTTLRKGNTVVDLHTRINVGTSGDYIPASRIIANSTSHVIDGLKIHSANTEFMLLHLLVHIDKHFHKGVTRYSNIVDIIFFLRKYASDMDWDKFRNASTESGAASINESWIMLLNHEFSMNLPLSEKCPDYYPKLKKSYEQWLTKGERINRPVVPPWQRSSFKNSSSFPQKIRYTGGILFPSAIYMKKAYGIKNGFLLICYYPYRLFKHTINYLLKNKSGH